jgi:hypothetical protein
MQKQLFAALLVAAFLSPVAAQADGSYVKFTRADPNIRGRKVRIVTPPCRWPMVLQSIKISMLSWATLILEK